MADLTLMIAGQSNGTQMCVVPVAGCDPTSGTYVWQPNTTWRAMTSSDGAGIIELANTLRFSGGYDNVYIYDCSYGGSSIVPASAGPTTNCWQNQSPGGPLSDCLTQVSAGVKVPQVVIWMQGEQEALYSLNNPSFDMVTNYTTCLDQLRNFMLGRWGVTPAQCTWMVTPVGYVSYGNTQRVRQAQQDYSNSTPGVIPGPPRDDLALLNEGGTLVHLTGPSCRTFAGRLAPGLLAYFQELKDMPDAATLDRLTALETASASLRSRVVTLETARAASAVELSNLTFRVTILETLASPPAPGTFGAGTFGTGTFR